MQAQFRMDRRSDRRNRSNAIHIVLSINEPIKTHIHQIRSNPITKHKKRIWKAIYDQTVKERPVGRKSSGPTQSHRDRRSQMQRVAGLARRYRTSNVHPRTFATTFSSSLCLLLTLLLLLRLLWRRAFAFSVLCVFLPRRRMVCVVCEGK